MIEMTSNKMLEEVEDSLSNCREKCIVTFEEYIESHAYHVENYANSDEEVLCLLEDQADLYFSPRILGITKDNSSLDSADLSESSEAFFSQQQFMPKWFPREYHIKTVQFSESQSSELHKKICELVVHFFSNTWLEAATNKGSNLDLYVCEHFTNEMIVNVRTGERRYV
jgi:hypothetical protein